LRYSSSKLKATNAEGEEALRIFSQELNDAKKIQSIVLNPGDAIILNNRTCVHGRNAIIGTERFDGMDRWLIRIYGYKFDTLPILKTLPDKQHVMTVDK